jgi:serine/threonine-protein kinase
MATVFLAKQKSLQRLVAIKMLPKRFSEDANYVSRFLKEGRAAAKLNHPNIVQAYDVSNHNGRHFFVMEYVEGNTVYDRIQETKRIDEGEAVVILIQSAKALQHAHEQGFIHRDIKPKNLMLTKTGQVKVADLGLARGLDDREAAKQEEGRAYGTPYYISPEQIRGKVDIGPAADIYGLGATGYHMVTGHVPFTGKNPNEVMERHLRTALTPPDQANPNLTASFCQVLEMMMEKDASDRYQSAADLLEDLELIAQGHPPHFARPKLDLADLAVQVPAPGPQTPLRQKAHVAGDGLSAMAIGSLVLNGLLLIVLLAIILTR